MNTPHIVMLSSSWPELTNWPSGTHKRTKPERRRSLPWKSAVFAFWVSKGHSTAVTGITCFPSRGYVSID